MYELLAKGKTIRCPLRIDRKHKCMEHQVSQIIILTASVVQPPTQDKTKAKHFFVLKKLQGI